MPSVEKNEFLELEILKQVEKNSNLNIRLLATKLNCNVRLTHSLMKKLINRGMLQVRKLNARRWNYRITSKGLAEKARKTYKFFEFSMQFYQEARESSSNICERIAKSGKSTVAFIGTGNLAEIIYVSAKEWNLDLVEVYSANGAAHFMGLPVQRLDALPNCSADSVILCMHQYDETTIAILKNGKDILKVF